MFQKKKEGQIRDFSRIWVNALPIKLAPTLKLDTFQWLLKLADNHLLKSYMVQFSSLSHLRSQPPQHSNTLYTNYNTYMYIYIWTTLLQLTTH